MGQGGTGLRWVPAMPAALGGGSLGSAASSSRVTAG